MSTWTRPVAEDRTAAAALILKICTALLTSFAAALVLVHAEAYFSPAPLMHDIDVLF
jgi:hypothetical protein